MECFCCAAYVAHWHTASAFDVRSYDGCWGVKRTCCERDQSVAGDPQRSFENSALDAFRLEDHVNCEDNRATRAPAGVPGGRLQRRTE